MPRFFFNLYDDAVTFDEEGLELPDLAGAKRIGLLNARYMAAEQVIAGTLHLSHRIEIIDEDRHVLEAIPFIRAFEIVA